MVKIMYFLTGNAPGFRVSEKTILDRCNISESGYKKARKKLVEMQWIFHKPGEYIQVNFNKIFKDYGSLQNGVSQAGVSHEPSQTNSKQTSTKLSNPSEDLSVDYGDISEYSWERYSENTYNNITNNINHNIKKINDNGFRCEDTPSAAAVPATASGVSSQPLRENYENRKEEEKQARRDFFSWFDRTDRMLMQKYNGCESNDDCLRYYASAEHAEFEEEQRKRREDFRKKFGKDI